MRNKYSIAYSEVLTILEHMEPEYESRIPKKLIDYFRENREPNYILDLDLSIPLYNNKLNENTKTVLAMLLINFWSNSPEEKQELINLYFENEQNYQAELSKKYDPDMMFSQNSKKEKIIIEDVPLENSLSSSNTTKWYEKIINILKKIFKKNHD